MKLSKTQCAGPATASPAQGICLCHAPLRSRAPQPALRACKAIAAQQCSLLQHSLQLQHQQRQQRPKCRARRRLACSAAVPPALVHAAATNLAGLLIGGGLFLLGLAACVFVITAIPAMQEARRTMVEMRQVLRTLDRELPDTAAALRLSGLELSDAIEEVSLLGNDLSQGVRATAAMVAGTRSGLSASAGLVGAAVSELLLPALRERMPAARSVVEASLQHRAKMGHKGPSLTEVAASTKVAAQRARASLAAADLLGLAARAAGAARSVRLPARGSPT